MDITAVFDFIREIFNPDLFMPHGHCYLWKPGVLFLHIFSDFVIGFSYYSIPFVLYYFARKRTDLPYRWMFLLFAIFIFACGTTHFMNILTIWKPVYWLDGGIKFVTAVASIVTAYLLFPIVPKALALRSPSELERANRKLEETIEELRKTQAELTRSNLELEQFAYIASHDLQEPVRMVAGFSSLLETSLGTNLTREQKEHLEIIEKSSRRMHQLVNDLLFFARLGKTRKLAKINSQEVLDNVLLNLKSLIDESGALITHPTLPAMTADRTQLAQVFQNLIVNGIKFQKKQHRPEIKIEYSENEKFHVFSVEDNGIGIKPEYQDKIFHIFQRLHRDEFPGTGIGLSSCKKIVEQHGGKITVQSEEDKGCKFIFTISKELVSD